MCQCQPLRSADSSLDLAGPEAPLVKKPSHDRIRYSIFNDITLTLRYVTDQTLSGLLPALKDKVDEAIIAGKQRQ